MHDILHIEGDSQKLHIQKEEERPSKNSNSTQYQALTWSSLTSVQDSFSNHLFSFRRDQSFTQTCTVCPASVNLAPHLASGSYGQQGSSQHLQKEGVRLASFKDFPTSAIRLAQTGIFYTGGRGYADCARCFYIGLKSWEPGDIPAEVHARWRSTCEYLRLVKGDEFVDQMANGGSNERNGHRSSSGVQNPQLLPHDHENPREDGIRNHGCNLRGVRDRATSNQLGTLHPTARSERSESHIIRPEGALLDESSQDFPTVDATAGTQYWNDTSDLPLRPGYDGWQNRQGGGRRITVVRLVHYRPIDGRQDRNGERSVHGDDDAGVLNQSSTIPHLTRVFGWVDNGRSGARQLSDVFGRNCHHCQSRPINVLLFNCHDCVLCHVCASEVNTCPRCNQQICGYWVQPF